MSKRIAYIGHHGTTLLFTALHQRLAEMGKANANPGFMTFNRYWEKEVKKKFPRAEVQLFAGRFSSASQKMSMNPTERARFERAKGLDKVLRKKSDSHVARLWMANRVRVRDFFEKFQPEIIFSELIQTLPCYAVYYEALDRKIPFVQLLSTRIAGRMEYMIDESGHPYGYRKTGAPSIEAQNMAQEVVANLKSRSYSGPSYMSLLNRKGLRLMDLSRKSAQHVKEYFSGGWLEPTARGLMHPFISKLNASRVRKRHDKSSTFKGLDDLRKLPGRKLLFPLHVTPESSTDLWAPRYNNMVEVSRSIVANLPAGWTLVMKEHPAAVWLQRSKKEIEELRRLDRTLFLSPQVPNATLLTLCDASIVVNGTFGWEALIKGFPVLTLGRPAYDESGNTFAVTDYSELPLILEKVVGFKPNQEKTLDHIARYIDATDLGMPDNPLLVENVMTAENISNIAAGIAKRFL